MVKGSPPGCPLAVAQGRTARKRSMAACAGELAVRSYGRNEEFNADKHGVDILRRAGYSKDVMIDSLAWIRRISGDKGGGFLSTHPGLDDRIATIQRLR